MKNQLTLLFMLVAFSISVFGKSKNDYSGTWDFIGINQKTSEKNHFVSKRFVITQTPKEVKIRTLINSQVQTDSGQNANGELVYPFNTENVVSLTKLEGEGSLKLKAEINNQGRLILLGLETIKTTAGEISTVKNYELTKVDNDLKIHYLSYQNETFNGLWNEMFIAQKQASENPSNIADNTFEMGAIPAFRNFNYEDLLKTAIKLNKPDYPSEARPVRASGGVSIRFIFDEKGDVIYANKINGHALLQNAALEAVLKCKFGSVKLDGKPIKVVGRITYSFSAS